MNHYEADKHLNSQIDYVEVTEGMNGYPQNLQAALVGFASFEEAEKFAKENDFRVVRLHKRAGWSLWECQGRAFEPMNPDASWYGELYSDYGSMTEDEFFDEFITEDISGIGNMECLKEFVKGMDELWNRFQELQPGERIVLREGDYYDTIGSDLMKWSEDTHTYIIAVT